MQIKNYTSGVAVETTVQRIESKLAASGASGVMKLYDPKGRVSALVFMIDVGQRKLSIKVPVNAQACFEAMWKDYRLHTRRISPGAEERLRDQAHRTAWKLMQEWIEIQVSMITMRQVEFTEVFLPYVWDGRQTYFESIRAGGFKALPERTDSSST